MAGSAGGRWSEDGAGRPAGTTAAATAASPAAACTPSSGRSPRTWRSTTRGWPSPGRARHHVTWTYRDPGFVGYRSNLRCRDCCFTQHHNSKSRASWHPSARRLAVCVQTCLVHRYSDILMLRFLQVHLMVDGPKTLAAFGPAGGHPSHGEWAKGFGMWASIICVPPPLHLGNAGRACGRCRRRSTTSEAVCVRAAAGEPARGASRGGPCTGPCTGPPQRTSARQREPPASPARLPPCRPAPSAGSRTTPAAPVAHRRRRGSTWATMPRGRGAGAHAGRGESAAARPAVHGACAGLQVTDRMSAVCHAERAQPGA